uniref:Uncharacterized protein n=1 Tax=Entomoneis paludosa TaxID=265537 RepID=A0A7S3DTT5_9STRA|mmetsp:Transcript_34766/g.72361  ORF Transcript_34766/g.72361 Transcript_34766/m.72361 type:complete len:191 (+) Transcript_34766:186-758(+)
MTMRNASPPASRSETRASSQRESVDTTTSVADTSAAANTSNNTTERVQERHKRRRVTPDRPTARTQNNSSRGDLEPHDFLLLTPLEAGFPALPQVSTPPGPPVPYSNVIYMGGRSDSTMVAPRPPPVALLENNHELPEEEDDDAELSILFNSTRRRLPSVTLKPRKSKRCLPDLGMVDAFPASWASLQAP